MDLSIIIVSFNVKSYLIECIYSVFNAAYEINNMKFEVIVVDNNSSDNTVPVLKKMFNDLVIIENSQNLGFSKAFNKAAKTARGKYILRLDSDTKLLPGSIKFMLEKLVQDKNKEIGLIVPKLLNGDKSLQYSITQKYPTPLNSIYYATGIPFLLEKIMPNYNYWGRQSYPNKAYFHDSFVLSASGACYLYRKELINEIGELDESYLVQFEDTDYCKRIKMNGYKIKFVNNALVIHYGGASNKSIKDQMMKGVPSMKIFFKKYFKYKAILFIIIYIILGPILFFIQITLFYILSLVKLKFIGLRQLALRNLFTTLYLILPN